MRCKFKRRYPGIDFMMKSTVLALCILTVTLLVCQKVAKEADSVAFVKHTVHSGETLWGIAGKYTDEKQDVRDYIYQIRTDNKLDNAEPLKVGKVLLLRTRK